MTSTTAILPVGPMREWCLTGYDSAPHDPLWDLCANTTRGREPDFTTICCDGEVIDTTVDIWRSVQGERTQMEVANMVCCRQAGLNPGGLLPLPADYTHCASGDPTPLASMAATNTENAQNFAVTYISASEGTADWTTRSTPSCLWVNTRNISATTEVTLPAARVTTLPPDSSDVYFTDHTSWSVSSQGSMNVTASGSRTTSQSSRLRSTSATSEPASASNTAAENKPWRLSAAEWPQSLLTLVLLATACGFVAIV